MSFIRGHAVLYFVCSYIVVSYIWAVLSIYSGWPSVFSYSLILDLDFVVARIWIPILQIIAILVGYFVSTRLPKIRSGLRLRIKWYSGPIFLSLILLYAAYVTFTFLASLGSTNLTGEIERLLANNSSRFLLILSAAAALLNRERDRFGKTSIIIVFYISAIFALADGTRGALVPLIMILMYGALRKDKFCLFLSLGLLLPLMIALQIGRTEARAFQRSFDLTFSSAAQSLGSFSVAYFFSYSQLHFFYAIDRFDGDFNTIDLIYSVMPVPTRFIPFELDALDWRIDRYRPLGAQQSLFFYSPIVFLVFNMLFGVVIYKVKGISSGAIRTFVSLILFLGFAMSFQYNLRGVQWFIWLAIFFIVMAGRNRTVKLT